MQKLELNDNYMSKIMAEDSDIVKLAYKEDLGDSVFKIIVEQGGEYFQGTVIEKPGNKYVIQGDTEFKRVYPVKDIKTGEIVKVNDSE